METATMTDDLPRVQTHTLLARAVCLILSCGYLGNHRKVDLGALDIEKDGAALGAEKEELHATKALFSSKDLRPVTSAIDAVKNRLRALSVDGGTRMFGPGAYLIPLAKLREAEDVLVEGAALVAVKTEELAARLPRLLEQRAAALGALFVASEYPTADQVRAAYRVRWSYVSFGAPEQLESVDRAVYLRAQQEWDDRLRSAGEDVVLGLRETALRVVRELAERLTPGDDGKPKALRGTALRDLQQLVADLPALNSIGEDGALPSALARVAALAEGLHVDALRKAPGIREALRREAEAATGVLDGLVATGRRAIGGL